METKTCAHCRSKKDDTFINHSGYDWHTTCFEVRIKRNVPDATRRGEIFDEVGLYHLEECQSPTIE